MAHLRQLFVCAFVSLCLSAFAGSPGGGPAKKPIPQPSPAPVEKPEVSANSLCFCADNVTNLQGCAVGAAKVVQDLSGQPAPICLDPQVSVRSQDKTPGFDAPEGCELQDIHTGEIREGHVQCVVTGTVVCK